MREWFVYCEVLGVSKIIKVQLLALLFLLVQRTMVPLLAQTWTQPPLGAPLPLLLTLVTAEADCLLASPAELLLEFPDSAHSTDSAMEMDPVMS